MGASVSGLTEKPYEAATEQDADALSPPNTPPPSPVLPSCMDLKYNTTPYPGSEPPTSQLLAALDRRISAEIAWAESNARSRGVLAHFRKPEVWNHTPFVVPPPDVVFHR